MEKYYVYFDGTSAFVEDYQCRNLEENLEVLGEFDNLDEAQTFCDETNIKINC